jgi:hypothetical protein
MGYILKVREGMVFCPETPGLASETGSTWDFSSLKICEASKSCLSAVRYYFGAQKRGGYWYKFISREHTGGI